MKEQPLANREQLYNELLAISKQPGGLTPTAVVAAARNPESPLHQYFCWDDTEAARRYREIQAYAIIRSVKVVIENPDQEAVTVRAFLPIKQVDDNGHINTNQRGVFWPITQIVEDADAMEQVISAAKRDLEAFAAKYSALESVAEFAPIFTEIRRIIINPKQLQLTN